MTAKALDLGWYAPTTPPPVGAAVLGYVGAEEGRTLKIYYGRATADRILLFHGGGLQGHYALFEDLTAWAFGPGEPDGSETVATFEAHLRAGGGTGRQAYEVAQEAAAARAEAAEVHRLLEQIRRERDELVQWKTEVATILGLSGFSRAEILVELREVFESRGRLLRARSKEAPRPPSEPAAPPATCGPEDFGGSDYE